MDHPLASPALAVKPWRTATVVLTAIAALELVLLVGAGLLLLGKTLAPHVQAAAEHKVHPATKAEPAPKQVAPPAPVRSPGPAVAHLSRAQTTVSVLNGNGLSGSAASAGQLVSARGYRLGTVTNAARTNYPRNLVMYRPGFRGEALRFAHDLSISIVTPLDGKASKLGPQLTMIVGRAT